MIDKVWNPDRITDQLQMMAVRRRRPLSCTLELTYRCNFHCKMCYVRMSDDQAALYGRMRTVEEWLEMARQLYDAGVLNLTLTGGECTLYPGFERLYERLAKMGFRITIMSNAGKYSDSIKEVFRHYPPANVGITLYGGSNETYKEVTGDSWGFEKAIENICFFQTIGVPVTLNFTVVRQNVLDYPKVGNVCRELGIPYTMITDISAHHYNASFSDALHCRLSPAERACIACHSPEEVATAMENARELEKELADFQMPVEPEDSPRPQQDSCIGSSSSCAIFWNGDMQTCISMRGYHCVKPFDIGFEAAWNQLKAEQDKTFTRPIICQVCNMAADCLHNCAGRRREATGSPQKPEPYTCEYTYLLRRYRMRHKQTELSPVSPCT